MSSLPDPEKGGREKGEGGPLLPSAFSIPPTVKGLSLVSLFNDFASEMVYPLLPAFVVGTLGGTATALGALVNHICGGADARHFQPMNINFGLFPPIPGAADGRGGRGQRKPALAARALADLDRWLAETRLAA